MTKQGYINSQLALGKTHSQIIAEQPIVDVVGSVRGDNLRNVVAILAGGLQHRLDNAPDSLVKTALLTAFRYMTLPDYAINLSLQENADLLSVAVRDGLVTPQEREQFFALATYKKPLYDITQADFVGEWHNLGEVSARQLIIKLKQKAPEQTHILVQSRDVFTDGAFGDWRHNTACYLELAGVYRCDIRAESRQEVRWSCAYKLDVEVG